MPPISSQQRRTFTPFAMKQFIRCVVKSHEIKIFLTLLAILNSLAIIVEVNREVKWRGIQRILSFIIHIFTTVCLTIEFILENIKLLYSERQREKVRKNGYSFMELFSLIGDWIMIIDRNFQLRQCPSFLQAVPLLHILRLCNFNKEMKVLYRSLGRTFRKVVPSLLIFFVSILIYGFWGFYMFHEDVPQLFEDIPGSIFRAFIYSTKDSWTDFQSIIEQKTKSTRTRWYSISLVFIVGTLLYNVIVASVTDSVTNARQRFVDNQKKKKLKKIKKYDKQIKALRKQRRIARRIEIETIMNEDECPWPNEKAPIDSDSLFINPEWISAVTRNTHSAIDDYARIIALYQAIITRLKNPETSRRDEDM